MSSKLDLVIGTNNRGKQREIRRLLEDLPVTLRTPDDLKLEIDIEESGDSFAENAMLKARAFRAATGMAALADDSGLSVDALAGAPGVHSARFGGPNCSPTQQIERLIELLKGIPTEKRGAEFVSAVAFSAPNGDEWTVEGRSRGRIADGVFDANRGFGYDPIFLVPDLGKTYGQMTDSEKDAVSHRGKAMKLARSRLENSLSLLE